MKTRSKFQTPLILLASIPLFQACGGAGAWEGTVTDSAGITVVHNTDVPMWRPGEEWTATEDLRIGTVAGDPEYQFGLLAWLEVGEDGTIYTLDMQAREVRAYNPEGRFIRTIGGPGEGPGEIGQGAVFVFDDGHGGLVVPDLLNQRVNRYASTGEPTGSFPISLQAGLPTLWAMDSAGRLLVQLKGIDVEGIASLEEGDPVVAYDTTGAIVDTVVMLPKGQSIEEISEERLSVVLFAPEPTWALDEDGSIFYALSDQYRILVNDPDGTLTRIITREWESKPVGESDEAAMLGAFRDLFTQMGVPPAQIDQIMQGFGFADFYPAFARILLGPGETLWVQRIRNADDMAALAEEGVEFDPQDIGSPDWEVFDGEGRYLGVVTLPERFSPVQVRGDHLYGLWSDELDVQYIMRLVVTRGSA